MLNKDKALLKVIEKDLPLSNKPFLGFAQKFNVSEEELISLIKNAKKEGLIRRYGAVLGHRKSGFTFNVMVVFILPEDTIDEIGEKFSKYSFVSHCYERYVCDEWPFNFYAMVHATSEEKMLQFIDELKMTAGDHPFKLLKSGKEYKKTSLKIL